MSLGRALPFSAGLGFASLDIFSIKAEKTIDEKESESLISNQRPNVIDKKVRLPIDIKEGEEKIESAKYENGVLTVVIPVQKHGKDITIE